MKDPRLHLACCEVCENMFRDLNNLPTAEGFKAACKWPPCPPNLDMWTPGELRKLMGEDPHRVDQAVAIWAAKPGTEVAQND